MDYIMLNDGTFIDTERELTAYLESLGFNRQELVEILAADVFRRNNELEALYVSMERDADEYYCHLRDMTIEVRKLAKKLATGKGGTKAAYAQKFIDIVNFYES